MVSVAIPNGGGTVTVSLSMHTGWTKELLPWSMPPNLHLKALDWQNISKNQTVPHISCNGCDMVLPLLLRMKEATEKVNYLSNLLCP